jgi:branched-chain amino acid transport system substrate-binding protein
MAGHRWLRGVASLVVVGVAVLSWGRPAAVHGQAAPVTVGLEAPLTGDDAQFGKVMEQGARMAFAQVNATGGILGHRVDLVPCDDQAKPATAVACAQRFVTQDHVVAVLGGFNSSPTLAAQAVTGKARVIQIHMGASPKLTDAHKTNPYLFRIILTSEKFAPYVARYVVGQLHHRRIAVLYENTDYGRSEADIFGPLASRLGAQVVAREAYNPGDKDFSAQITKIKSLRPDAIMIGGLYTEAALIAQQAHQAGLSVQLFGISDGVDSPQLIALGGRDVEGYIFASMIDLDRRDPQVLAFTRLARTMGVTPEAYTAITYDAAEVLARALRAGGLDPDRTRDALATIRMTGVTGPISFDANGDRNSAPFIRQVKGGTFVTVVAPH